MLENVKILENANMKDEKQPFTPNNQRQLKSMANLIQSENSHNVLNELLLHEKFTVCFCPTGLCIYGFICDSIELLCFYPHGENIGVF